MPTILVNNQGGREKRAREIIDLRKSRKTYEEIGNVYGLSRQRIEQILKVFAPELACRESGPLPIQPIHKVCTQCGKEFVTKYANRITCSRVCGYKSSSEKRNVFHLGVASYTKEYRRALYEYNKVHRPQLLKERDERSVAVHRYRLKNDPAYRRHVQVYAKEWFTKNRDRLRQLAKKRYWANPDKYRAVQRLAYQKRKRLQG